MSLQNSNSNAEFKETSIHRESRPSEATARGGRGGKRSSHTVIVADDTGGDRCDLDVMKEREGGSGKRSVV